MGFLNEKCPVSDYTNFPMLQSKIFWILSQSVTIDKYITININITISNNEKLSYRYTMYIFDFFWFIVNYINCIIIDYLMTFHSKVTRHSRTDLWEWKVIKVNYDIIFIIIILLILMFSWCYFLSFLFYPEYEYFSVKSTAAWCNM